MAIRRAVPDIASPDPAASRPFYAGVLGFSVGMDAGGIITFVSPTNATAQVTVMQADPDADDVPGITIEVDDVDAVYTRAIADGFEIVRGVRDEPWGVRRFFVRDPNGVVVNVMRHITAGG